MFLNGPEIPPCLQQLSGTARAKAVAIANTLLSLGMEENKTLRIAIATATHQTRNGGQWMFDDDV